jgi:ParB family chromosome partitioning protein
VIDEATGGDELRDRGDGQGLVELELWQLEPRFAALRIASRERHRHLVASLLEHGQQAPLLAVSGIEPARYALIDGYARLGALREIGRDTARTLVLPLDEAAGLVLGYRLHGGQRRTAIEEGWLVRELMQSHGLRLEEAAAQLGHTKSWASRRLGLVRDLSEPVQDLVRQGRLCPYTAMRSLLPLARANSKTKAEVTAVAEVVVRDRLSARQTQVLCAAWRAASSEQRAALLASPRAYLKVDEVLGMTAPAVKRDPPEQPQLVRDFEVLISVARRAEGVLRGYSRGTHELGESEALVLVWPRTRQAFEALARQVERRLETGLGNTDGHPSVDA